MPIEPCWPRVPYNVEIKEDDIEPLCTPDGDNPTQGLQLFLSQNVPQALVVSYYLQFPTRRKNIHRR